MRSLPTRERGLKFVDRKNDGAKELVAPYAGAWIEIMNMMEFYIGALVAPYAGAWIEICVGSGVVTVCWSLPTRERGLKLWYVGLFSHLFMSLPTRERGLKSGCI